MLILLDKYFNFKHTDAKIYVPMPVKISIIILTIKNIDKTDPHIILRYSSINKQ